MTYLSTVPFIEYFNVLCTCFKFWFAYIKNEQNAFSTQKSRNLQVLCHIILYFYTGMGGGGLGTCNCQPVTELTLINNSTSVNEQNIQYLCLFLVVIYCDCVREYIINLVLFVANIYMVDCMWSFTAVNVHFLQL